jgi:hypothetical protein
MDRPVDLDSPGGLGDTGTPMSVQQQVIEHASMQTTNVYGEARREAKRQANGKIVLWC